MKYTFIDFETANNKRSSICAVGLSEWEDGREINSFYSLVKPAPYEFAENLSEIHGIKSCDVETAPALIDIWDKIKPFFENLVITHNAAFDVGCLKSYFQLLENSDFPDFKYLCTMQLARKFGIIPTSLEDVCDYFKIEYKNAHNALSDARMCAEVFSNLKKQFGNISAYIKSSKEASVERERDFEIKSLEPVQYEVPACSDEWIKSCAEKFARIEAAGQLNEFYAALETARKSVKEKYTKKQGEFKFSAPEHIEFIGKNFVITGGFLNIDRGDLANRIVQKGGIFQKFSTKKTDYVIIGDLGSNDYAYGHFGTKVAYLLSRNVPCQYIAEKDFLKFL